MIESTHFQINTSQVAHEIIEAEVVIIHLKSGTYYSLQNVGASIWSLIESGANVTEIIEQITHQFDGNRSDIENAVNQLISELQEENLIEPASSEDSARKPADETVTEIHSTTDKPPFETPVLEKYEDMQDLLLLDPIHEVDETGWPHRQEQN